jgi:hypothetical protein
MCLTDAQRRDVPLVAARAPRTLRRGDRRGGCGDGERSRGDRENECDGYAERGGWEWRGGWERRPR